jgi:hypothetical protein
VDPEEAAKRAHKRAEDAARRAADARERVRQVALKRLEWTVASAESLAESEQHGQRRAAQAAEERADAEREREDDERARKR